MADPKSPPPAPTDDAAAAARRARIAAHPWTPLERQMFGLDPPAFGPARGSTSGWVSTTGEPLPPPRFVSPAYELPEPLSHADLPGIPRIRLGDPLPAFSDDPRIRSDLNALCRARAAEIRDLLFALARNARDERVRLQAAQYLGDRGFGRPVAITAASVEITSRSAAEFTDADLLARRRGVALAADVVPINAPEPGEPVV